MGTATISPLQSYSVATVPSSPVRSPSVSVTTWVPCRVWNEIVAIWYMNSVAVLTSGSLGSRSDSTIGNFQSSCEQRHDRLAAFDLAAVDELAVVVVVELDVLDLAEGLERVVATLHLAVGNACADEVTDSDKDQEDPE